MKKKIIIVGIILVFFTLLSASLYFGSIRREQRVVTKESPQKNLNWNDVNKDGITELVLKVYSGGNGWTSVNQQILQVEDDGSAIDLTGYINRDFVSSVKEIEDLSGDNIPELLVLDARWEFFWSLCHTCSPQVEKVYVWGKNGYEDRSLDYKDRYLSNIDSARILVKQLYGKNDMIEGAFGSAIAMLLDYEIIGEKDKGWKEFLELTDLKNWSNLNKATVTRFEELRNFLKKEYESGKEFSPKGGESYFFKTTKE
ncbi:MAG: hypothetical protein Q7S03_01065 [bacterium]|nr:hypothetical protein [bacterium]